MLLSSYHHIIILFLINVQGHHTLPGNWLAAHIAQWLSGRVLDSRPKGRGFEPHRRHCVVSLSKNINPSLVLVQPRKTCPFITERLLMGRKESNQTNKAHIADLTPDLQGAPFLRVNCRELQLTAVILCQFLPCKLGPPCPPPAINMYITC